MNSAPLHTGAAFDVRALDSLKRASREDPQEGLKAAAKQMEGMFVQMMLKSMRDATFKDGLLNSQQTEMFTSMYDQQIAQEIAQKGDLGLAEMMLKQMGVEPDEGTTSTGTTEVPLLIDTSGFKQVPQRIAAQDTREAPGETARARFANRSMKSDSFISRLLKPAIEASQKSGVPHQLIIAQAALESGWGNREILTQDGKPSYNLFGIKATGGWKGKTTEITTTEYINGKPQKIKAAFRVYDSYAHALEDHAALLTKNPRYQGVPRSPTLEGAAHALQSGGYATDPKYAKKLISVMQQVKHNVNEALNAYKNDLSSLF